MSRSTSCWTSHLLFATNASSCSWLRQKICSFNPSDLCQLVVDLRSRHLACWRRDSFLLIILETLTEKHLPIITGMLSQPRMCMSHIPLTICPNTYTWTYLSMERGPIPSLCPYYQSLFPLPVILLMPKMTSRMKSMSFSNTLNPRSVLLTQEPSLIFWPSPPSLPPFSSDGSLSTYHSPCTVFSL